MEMAVDDTPYSRHYFASATEPVRKEIYETKIASHTPPNFLNISYGISQMRKGMYAFHTELVTGYKFVKDTFYEHEKCGLLEISYLEVRMMSEKENLFTFSTYKNLNQFAGGRSLSCDSKALTVQRDI